MEAVNQLASAGTFRVVKEPLAFLRVLEWGKYSTSAPDLPEGDVWKTPDDDDPDSS